MEKPKWATKAAAAAALMAGVVMLAPRAAAADPLTLGVGEQHELSLDGMKSYTVSSTTLVTAHIVHNSLVIEGKKPGSLQVLFVRADGSQITYDITVK